MSAAFPRDVRHPQGGADASLALCDLMWGFLQQASITVIDNIKAPPNLRSR